MNRHALSTPRPARLGLTAIRTALGLSFALLATGCGTSDNIIGVDEGRVRFVLSGDDGPVVTGVEGLTQDPTTARDASGPLLNDDEDSYEPERRFQSANVTFASILARNLDGVLVNVGMELPVTVDVLTMEGGREIMLPEGELPAGNYDQVVVVMTQVEVVMWDGTTITVTPPGGGWTAIAPICPFVVDDGGTTTVSLKFMIRHAFKWRNDRHHFEPRFHCGEDVT